MNFGGEKEHFSFCGSDARISIDAEYLSFCEFITDLFGCILVLFWLIFWLMFYILKIFNKSKCWYKAEL